MEKWLKQVSGFDTMITPIIIKILFWIGVIGCIIAGIGMFFSGAGVVSGLLVILLGPLLVRVYCEIIIIMFKIFQALKQIEDKMTDDDPEYNSPNPSTRFTAPAAEQVDIIE